MKNPFPLFNKKPPIHLQKSSGISMENLIGISTSQSCPQACEDVQSVSAQINGQTSPSRRLENQREELSNSQEPNTPKSKRRGEGELFRNEPQSQQNKRPKHSDSQEEEEYPQNAFELAYYNVSSRELPSPADETLPKELSIVALLRRFSSLPVPAQSLVLIDFLRKSRFETVQNVSGFISNSLCFDFIPLLPREIITLILSKLDIVSLSKCSVISRTWNKLIDEDSKLWKGLIVNEGWEFRLIRELWHLSRAGFDLVPERLSDSFFRAAKLSDFGKEGVVRIDYDELRKNPLLLFPTTAHYYQSYNPSKLYKIMYSHYYSMRRNWFTGNCNRKSFQAFGGGVITNLVIDIDRIICGSDDKTICSFDIHTGEELCSLSGHDGGVWCLETCGPQRNTLISGSTDRSVRIWDIARSRCLQTLKGHSSTIRCLLVIPSPTRCFESQEDIDRKYWIITGARDATIKVWEVSLAPPPPSPTVQTTAIQTLYDNSKEQRQDNFTFLPRVRTTSVAADTSRTNNQHFLHEENSIANIAENDETVNIGELGYSPEESAGQINEGDSHLFTLSGHASSVRAMAAHGKTLVSASYDATLRVWDLVARTCTHVLTGHTNKVYSLVYDWKHNRAISGSMDHTIRIWSTLTGECLHVFEGHSGLVGLMQLEICSFLPQFSFHKYSPQLYESYVEHPEPAQELPQITPIFDKYTSATFPSNKKRHPVLVSAAADSTIKVWDLERNVLMDTFYGHRTSITCFQFDNDKLVSGGEGSIKIWDLRTGSFVRDLVTNIGGAWKIALNERYCVCAVQRDQLTWFEIMDFGVPSHKLSRF